MKKVLFILTSVLLIATKVTFAQDVISPYTVIEYTDHPEDVIPGVPSPPFWGNTTFPFEVDFVYNNTQHTGPYYVNEYEINMENHFWWDQYVAPMPSIFSLSYQYELVSFPFTMNCSFEVDGCCGKIPLNERKMYMPDPTVSSYNKPSGTGLKHSYGVETSIAPVISVNN